MSVLYDEPGPVARRRAMWGSVAGGVVILGLLTAGFWYAANKGVFASDRWDVLYDPPKNQQAIDVWRSLVVQGLGATLGAAVIAAPLALALGVALALCRTATRRWAAWPANVVIEFFRGLPVLLMMLLAQLGFRWDTLPAVVFGLVVYNMAVIAEILRAGLAALPQGQREAALTVGLTRWQSLRLVELPQAVRIMTPSLVAQLVVLLKDSSLGFIIGYAELLRRIQLNTSFFGPRYAVALFVVGAGIYLVVNISLSQLALRLQRRIGRPAGVPATAVPAGALVVSARETPAVQDPAREHTDGDATGRT